MAELVAFFQTPSGAGLVGPAGADIPEILIVTSPGNVLAQASTDMAELTLAPGWFRFTFAPVDGLEYVWIADGDPAATGQVPATGRLVRGVISGTTTARHEVDIPAILDDTDSLDTTKITTARADNLDEITATRLSELDPANLPADIDAILADTTAGGAGPWATAVGFSTPADITAATVAVLAAIAGLNDPTAAAIADAVWTEILAAHETTNGSAAQAVASLRNRIRFDNTVGPPRQLVVFRQDGVTELYRADVTTLVGTDVLAFFGVQHERAVPVP